MKLEDVLFRDRVRLAESLRGIKREVAESVTDEFFLRHPDWLIRYGERGRKHGIEDAGYHVEYLAGAVESGSVAAFEDYARWTARVLSSRGIASDFLAENLRQVERAVFARVGPGDGEAVSQIVDAGCKACSGGGVSDQLEETTSPLAESRALFLQAILKGQRAAAGQIALESMREGHPMQDIYIELFQESQYEVGRRWESNQITVAEEHMATAITQFAMAQVYPQIELSSAMKGKAVITGVEGEMHQVGANMVADVMEADGWDVRFLGVNAPHAGILEAVEEHGADVLGVSATMLFNVPAVVRLIDSVRGRFGEQSPKIIVGGGAFRLAPHLPAELGAVGFAKDLRELQNLAL